MPKALYKSKHGRKASVTEQSLAQAIPPGSPAPQQVSKDLTVKGPISHHKAHKVSVSSSRDEQRRDKALKKICSKASSILSVVAPAIPAGDQVASVSSDQLSLRDCPISIPTEGL